MSKARKLSRRQTTKLMVLGAVLPVRTLQSSPQVTSHHSSATPSKTQLSWTPKFFSAQQNETVAVLAELIIPQTETPGARAAKVNEFIDLVLSEESPKIQQEFVRGLDWLDRKSNQLFKLRFIQLNPAQQQRLLEGVASEGNTTAGDQVGVAFFKDIKARTIFAYYTSEVGIHQELQYKGLDYLTEFPGCQHPEHLNWDPKA
jgi:hypothetical protein